MIILLIIMYTYLCFTVFGYHDADKKESMLRSQNQIMFLMHLMAFIVLYLEMNDLKVIMFYIAQVIFFGATILLYTKIYPKVSRLIVNNMCMLLCVGFIMLTRLSFEKSIKQFVIASCALVISLLVPIIIRKLKVLSEWRKFYAIVGMVSLGVVAVMGQVSNGAKLGFTIAGISIQPSELVKIVFVFFVAASFKAATDFKNVVITTIVAAIHVLILVISTDLGAALIIFVVYLVMLYVATRQPLYMMAGFGAGGIASVIGYRLFYHVKTRVAVWKDPFATYDNGGYQVAQSLFAIGTGGWFGMGLYQGQPDKIPVAAEDFIFSAISEELGLIFALCLIMICLSCYIMFLNIAMQLRNQFYKLVALGLGTCYIFQVFLTIGGVTKFIPSTGVTLPLVSYGGSSLLSTLIMFGIIQGLYIVREDEEEKIERKRKEREQERELELELEQKAKKRRERERRQNAEKRQDIGLGYKEEERVRTSRSRKGIPEEGRKKTVKPERTKRSEARRQTSAKEKERSQQRIR